MVLPTIPISFLRTVRSKEGRRSTNLADNLDPNPITSNSHITDLSSTHNQPLPFFKISISAEVSDQNRFYQQKVLYHQHYRFHQLLPISPTTIPSFQSQPTNTDTHHKKVTPTTIPSFQSQPTNTDY